MKALKNLEKWFFSFWIVQSKITYLLAIIIAVFWFFALDSIPKESDPQINFPIVNITTQYEWVAASIINDEITEKLEQSLQDIDGISEISSTSSQGRSSIRVNIEDGFDASEVTGEIETAVDWVTLPAAVDDDFPIVSQIDITSSDMFTIIMYGDTEKFNFESLLDIAAELQASTQWTPWVEDVRIDSNTNYDIRIKLEQSKLDILWLSLDNISSAITSSNIDSPIGNYDLDWESYSYKLSGKIKTLEELLTTRIPLNNGEVVLWDISTTDLYYGEEQINRFWIGEEIGFNYISLTYSKLSGANIFEVSEIAKTSVEQELSKDRYDWLSIVYIDDEAERVTNDFSDLSFSALQTLFLVFLALIFFVGVRESAIATMILPLAFLLWFIIVNYLDQTFNRISTFAFVLAFGIAIDTIIIIVEGAAEKVRQWYNPRTAILIALQEYKSPIIIGTITTLSAFIPVLTLPGILGLFLSFIPIVVFIILLSTLFVSLTIAGPIFILFSRAKKQYEVFPEREKVMSPDDFQLLTLERQWKIEKTEQTFSLRDKIFRKYSMGYNRVLHFILSTKKWRILTILFPVFLLVFSWIFFTSKLGFELFPQWARDQISINLTGPSDTTPSSLTEEIKFMENILADSPEIEKYTLSISWNRISSRIYLFPAVDRLQDGLRNNTILQENITEQLNEEFRPLWFQAGSRSFRRWPWSSDPVGINIVASNSELFDSIVSLTSDFESYLRTLPDVSDVSISASEAVTTIDFTLNQDTAKILWVSERDVFTAISSAVRGRNSITIAGPTDDHQVKLYIKEFMDNLSPSDIENISLNIWWNQILAGSVIDYSVTRSSPSITRQDGNIQVSVTASLIERGAAWDVQSSLEEFAASYNFPDGIWFTRWWENAENEELISTVLQWVFLAFFFIFAVLVYQFNSYAQPAVILYSVFMSLSWVIFGLYITGNPLSMPVGIWFISLMWIVVNDAIVMVDKINKNISQWMILTTAIIEWAISRLNPILVTTITTIAGILPIALQDVFWAGLWYTIVFWLAMGSFLTLIVIPALYYAMSPKTLKQN
jgi:multidrug efflux pump subunit AcrB